MYIVFYLAPQLMEVFSGERNQHSCEKPAVLICLASQ